MTIVVSPCREVWIGICFDVARDTSQDPTNENSSEHKSINARIDVVLRGEILRTTPNIDIIWILVYPNPVDAKVVREGQVCQIDCAEIF